MVPVSRVIKNGRLRPNASGGFGLRGSPGRYLTRPTYAKHSRVAATGFNYGY